MFRINETKNEKLIRQIKSGKIKPILPNKNTDAITVKFIVDFLKNEKNLKYLQNIKELKFNLPVFKDLDKTENYRDLEIYDLLSTLKSSNPNLRVVLTFQNQDMGFINEKFCNKLLNHEFPANLKLKHLGEISDRPSEKSRVLLKKILEKMPPGFEVEVTKPYFYKKSEDVDFKQFIKEKEISSVKMSKAVARGVGIGVIAAIGVTLIAALLSIIFFPVFLIIMSAIAAAPLITGIVFTCIVGIGLLAGATFGSMREVGELKYSKEQKMTLVSCGPPEKNNKNAITTHIDATREKNNKTAYTDNKSVTLHGDSAKRKRQDGALEEPQQDKTRKGVKINH